MQRALRTVLGSAASSGDPSSRGFSRSVPATALSRPSPRWVLTLVPFPKRAPRRVGLQHVPIVVDTGIGAVCSLAAKRSPAAPPPHTRLLASSAVPPPVVVGPPPGASRGPGRRSCAPAAAYIHDRFPAALLLAFAFAGPSALGAPRTGVASVAVCSRQAPSPSRERAPPVQAQAASSSDAAAAQASSPARCAGSPSPRSTLPPSGASFPHRQRPRPPRDDDLRLVRLVWLTSLCDASRHAAA